MLITLSKLENLLFIIRFVINFTLLSLLKGLSPPKKIDIIDCIGHCHASLSGCHWLTLLLHDK